MAYRSDTQIVALGRVQWSALAERELSNPQPPSEPPEPKAYPDSARR
jgi:hypothetical protein